MECHCFNSNASVKLAKLDPVFSSIVTCDSEPALREALDGCPATWTTYVFPVAVGVVAYLLGCLTIVLTRGKKDRSQRTSRAPKNMDVTLANTSSHYFQPRNENRENDPYPPKVAGFPKKSARNFRKGNSSAGYVLPVNRTPFYFNAQEDPAHIYEAVI